MYRLNNGKVILVILLILFILILIRNAWLGDDAFITFRTVDNFINGYGLTWNVGERVQAYTHPLWMFLVIIAYAVTDEIFLTVIFLSIIISVLAVAILAFKVARSTVAAVLGIILLLLSKPFIDYTVAGLENPLTHLIIVLFYWKYFSESHDIKSLTVLSLIASFGVLNRMDTLLIFLPPLVYLFFKLPRLRAFYAIMAGFTPFILWICFSLFYYGFPFPNTAYAKLNTGIDSGALISQGYTYTRNLVSRSPITALIIIGAVLSSLVTKTRSMIPPAVGIILYVLYIVKIGGDFMSGRCFAAPFLCAVLILSQRRFSERSRDWYAIVGAVLILGLAWPRCPVWCGADYGKGNERLDWDKGISDERAAYYQDNGLLNVLQKDELPSNDWANHGRELRTYGDTAVSMGAIGFTGFCAGPEVYVIGGHSLTDAFTARLPVTSPVKWRIGHFYRRLPEGYFETLKGGENVIYDPDLAKYYDKLSILISGNLFKWKRLHEILKFNIRRYDFLLERYLSRPLLHLSYDKVSRPVKQGTAYNANACYILTESGININLEGKQHCDRIELSVDHNDDYKIIFYLDSLEIGSRIIPYNWIPERGMRVDTLDVASEITEKGYNNVTILPVKGDGGYSFGHLRLL